MAHELEKNEKGEAKMFFAGEVPWHGLGTFVEKEITAEAAIRLSGLDTVADLRPLYVDNSIGNALPIDNYCAVVRREDDKVLGVVGKGYKIIQNKDCFSFMDAIVGEGQAIYHTAGSLFEGRKIFITCKLPTSMSIGSDKIDKYLLLISSHDGSMAVHMKWTPVRVVCANTLSASLKILDKKGKANIVSAVQVKHTKNFAGNVSKARVALGLAEYYYEQLELCCNKLLDYKMSDTEMEKFAEEVFPKTVNEKGALILSKQTKKMREKICELFHTGLGQKEVTNTKWAAYNSVTEYVDHYRTIYPRSKSIGNAHFMSTLFESGATLKSKAFDILTSDVVNN